MGKEKKKKERGTEHMFSSLRGGVAKIFQGKDHHNNNSTLIQKSQSIEPIPEVVPEEEPSLMIKAEVIHQYDRKDEDEISIKPGDQLWIYYKHPSGWWTGECDGNYGLFPASFVKEIEDLTEKVRIPDEIDELRNGASKSVLVTKNEKTKMTTTENSPRKNLGENDKTMPQNAKKSQNQIHEQQNAEIMVKDLQNENNNLKKSLALAQQEKRALIKKAEDATKQLYEIQEELNEKSQYLQNAEREVYQTKLSLNDLELKAQQKKQTITNLQTELSKEKEKFQELEEQLKTSQIKERKNIHTHSEIEMLRQENDNLRDSLTKKREIQSQLTEDEKEQKLRQLEFRVEEFKQEREMIADEISRQKKELDKETEFVQLLISQSKSNENDVQQLRVQVQNLKQKLETQALEHEQQKKLHQLQLENEFSKRQIEQKKKKESLTQKEMLLEKREKELKQKEEAFSRFSHNFPAPSPIRKPTRPYSQMSVIGKPPLPALAEPELERSGSGRFVFKLKSTGINLREGLPPQKQNNNN